MIMASTKESKGFPVHLDKDDIRAPGKGANRFLQIRLWIRLSFFLQFTKSSVKWRRLLSSIAVFSINHLLSPFLCFRAAWGLSHIPLLGNGGAIACTLLSACLILPYHPCFNKNIFLHQVSQGFFLGHLFTAPISPQKLVERLKLVSQRNISY